MFLGKKTKKLIVVTPSDKKIGETSIREAHDRLLLHRAVTVFIFNPRGELLITKRSRKKGSGLFTGKAPVQPMFMQGKHIKPQLREG